MTPDGEGEWFCRQCGRRLYKVDGQVVGHHAPEKTGDRPLRPYELVRWCKGGKPGAGPRSLGCHLVTDMELETPRSRSVRSRRSQRKIVAGYRADVLESVEPVIRGLSEADLETTNPDRKPASSATGPDVQLGPGPECSQHIGQVPYIRGLMPDQEGWRR